MAGIDKAAIAFSIIIVAIGVGFAFYMNGIQEEGSVISAPTISIKAVEPETQTDPFADLAEKVKEESSMVEEKELEETPEESAGPKTHVVDIPVGTSVPGCEGTNACYLPADITINAGDTVDWINVDTAAHTVTSGSPTDGPFGVFDSSLVMADATYAFTFEDAGIYNYFCMIHPWMLGSVTVN